MATEFTCKIGRSPVDTRDYTHISLWSNACKCDLTNSTTKVYSVVHHVVTIGGMKDSTIVHLYRGVTQLNYQATALHTTSTQVLLSDIQGTDVPIIGDVLKEGNSSSYDYLTLTNTGDSVIAVAECYFDNLAESWDNIVIKGWKTSSTNYIKIYTPTTERHTGTAYTGFGLYDPTVNNLLFLENVDIVIDGLEFRGGGHQITGNYSYGTKTISISNCIFHDNNWGSLIRPPLYSTLTLKIWNCILYNSMQNAIDFGSPSTIYIENCTIYNPGSYGIAAGQCYNNIVHRGNSYFDCFGPTCTGDYNCDGTEVGTDGTAPGIHSLHSKRLSDISWYSTIAYPTFNYYDIDLHTYDNSILVNKGINRSTGSIGFNTDILDVDRLGYYWDIGAFQIGGSSSYSSSSSSSSSLSSSSSSSTSPSSSSSSTSSSSTSSSSTSSSSTSSSSSYSEHLQEIFIRDYIPITDLTLRDYKQRGTIK